MGQHGLARILSSTHRIQSRPIGTTVLYRIGSLQLLRNSHVYLRSLMLFENVRIPHVGSLRSDRLHGGHRIRSRLFLQTERRNVRSGNPHHTKCVRDPSAHSSVRLVCHRRTLRLSCVSPLNGTLAARVTNKPESALMPRPSGRLFPIALEKSDCILC